MYGPDVVLVIELESLTWNTANWTQGIDNTVPLRGARVGQLLKQRQEDIDAEIQILHESRDANNHYFDQAANLRAEDL